MHNLQEANIFSSLKVLKHSNKCSSKCFCTVNSLESGASLFFCSFTLVAGFGGASGYLTVKPNSTYIALLSASHFPYYCRELLQ